MMCETSSHGSRVWTASGFIDGHEPVALAPRRRWRLAVAALAMSFGCGWVAQSTRDLPPERAVAAMLDDEAGTQIRKLALMRLRAVSLSSVAALREAACSDDVELRAAARRSLQMLQESMND